MNDPNFETTQVVAKAFMVGIMRQLRNSKNFSGFLASARFKAQDLSYIGDSMSFGMSSYILAGKHEEEQHYLEYSTYPSWWEHFKDECFPEWLKNWFPPKREDHQELVYYTGPVYVCPHHDIDFRTQKDKHLKWLMRTDPLVLPTKETKP